MSLPTIAVSVKSIQTWQGNVMEMQWRWAMVCASHHRAACSVIGDSRCSELAAAACLHRPASANLLVLLSDAICLFFWSKTPLSSVILTASSADLHFAARTKSGSGQRSVAEQSVGSQSTQVKVGVCMWSRAVGGIGSSNSMQSAHDLVSLPACWWLFVALYLRKTYRRRWTFSKCKPSSTAAPPCAHTRAG